MKFKRKINLKIGKSIYSVSIQVTVFNRKII